MNSESRTQEPVEKVVFGLAFYSQFRLLAPEFCNIADSVAALQIISQGEAF
jgi:hypothetical protein